MIEVGAGRRQAGADRPKGADYSALPGATVITPNRAELQQVVGRWRDEATTCARPGQLREHGTGRAPC